MSTQTTATLGAVLPDSEGSSDKVSRYNLAIETVLEAVLAGRLSKSVAGSSNVTLTDEEGRNARMEFTGALTGNISVLLRVPTGTPAGYSARRFSVTNSTTGDFTLTIKTTAGGSTGVVVRRGQTRLLEHNGTNVVDAVTETGVPTIAARVYHSVNQSIANATDTALAFNSERFDTDTIHDNSTNNSRLTCKTAGKYQISLTVYFDANATGYRKASIRLNGTTEIALDIRAAASGVGTGIAISVLYDLAVNDYVEAIVQQNSGGALLMMSLGNVSPEFMMVRVG